MTAALTVGAIGGCPAGDGLLPTLFSGDGDTGGGSGEATDSPTGTDSSSIEPDPAGSADIVEGQPGTVAFIQGESARLAQVIDENGGVHEFVVFTDESGEEYAAEYRYESDTGTLSVTVDPDGQIETIDVYDAESNSWVQLALLWSDATHALVNMTTSENSSVVGHEIELDEPLQTAKALHLRARQRFASHKAGLRAQPTDEQQLSLPVKITYKDRSGNVVTGLRSTFRLRALDNSAIFGVARGREALVPGTYSALIPAYRYRRVAGDYPEWKPTMEWGVYTVTAASLILVGLPLAPEVTAAIAVSQALGLTFLPGVVDRVMGGEYSDVPYPTALGQNVDYFQVWVSCNDRKHTTVLSGPISYDVLYDDYIEPRQFLDLGTVTVERTFEQPAPGYRLYLLPQIGRGQIEVLPEGSENGDLRLCDFAGGGLDCTVEAQVQPMSDVFATKQEAVLSICDSVSEVRILPLGVGPAAYFGEDDSKFLSYEVYYILDTCVD